MRTLRARRLFRRLPTLCGDAPKWWGGETANQFGRRCEIPLSWCPTHLLGAWLEPWEPEAEGSREIILKERIHV